MFSVAIPIYNHSRYLRRAVYSCLASPLVKEILLVDDGSTDDSVLIARDLTEAHPDRILNLTESAPVNRGAHIRLNQLCTAASQPWIAILNSDDFFPAHRFDLIRLIARTEGCDFVSGSMLIIDDNDRVIGTKRGILQPEYPCPLAATLDGPLRTDDLRRLLCNQNFIATTSNIAFRKSLYERIGGFADLRYAHDWDFALRATTTGHCVWTPNFLTCYRVHGTNTIKEQSPHMDGEIVRLFYRFLADYPQLETDPEIQVALASNQHIAPYAPPIQLPAISGAEEDSNIYRAYHFPPPLDQHSLLNALLGIYYFSYDFLVISSSLDEPPALRCKSLSDALIFRSALNLSAGNPPASLRGRFVRIPTLDHAATVIPDIRTAPGWNRAQIHGADIFFGTPATDHGALQRSALTALFEILRPRDARPTCLVLPIFMAVGGVERNTVEIIRALGDTYRFVVVTTERLTKGQGSLHHQLKESEIPVFDLGELGAPEHHLALLSVITQLTNPDIVWICNGSPWLADHASQIRRLFAKIPIIDQQVYDTEFGWINIYDKKGIQSFDRFIAINRRIYDKFTKQLRIPRHRIHLIYPAIGEEKIRTEAEPGSLPVAITQYIASKRPEGKLFVFVGRLTDQKRPLEFLRLATYASRQHTNDHFIMLGDGELRPECEAFITANKLRNVTSLPYHPSPPQIFRLADGMIITSMFEGLPVAMLEALTVGTPVFSTDVGDIRLILEDYGSGMVVPPDISEEGLQAAFTNWRGDLDAYTRRASASAGSVLARFSAATIASEYRKCFASLCRAKPQSSTKPRISTSMGLVA